VEDGFRRVASRSIYRGAVIELLVDTFAAPDGSTFEREVVRHPGAVSVVPVLFDVEGTPSVVMVRQFRAPFGELMLEIPAGKRDVEGEPPERTAARELEEETGLRPARLDLLAEFRNSPGFCDEHSWVYLATELEPAERSNHSVEEQHMTVEQVPLHDVPELISRGEITDAKSIIGLLLALRRVR